MNQAERIAVFQAQTRNVQKLVQVRCHIARSVNEALRLNNEASAEVHTRSLALVFCAWVEASFSKLIHTPYGFTLNEIDQIKQHDGRQRSIEDAWQKAIQLGLIRVDAGAGFRQNRRQEIERLVKEYVVEPSLIRNKIAHGQWEIALNRNNSAVNPVITAAIQQLDIVVIDRWFETLSHLALLLETLVESPGKAFHRDYWIHVTNLRDYIAKTKHWTLADKKAKLQFKRSLKDAKKPAKNGVNRCSESGGIWN